MTTDKSTFEITPVPIADNTYIKSCYYSSRDQISTEFQCTSIYQVEALMVATLQAALYYLSPAKIVFLAFQAVLKNLIGKIQSIYSCN